MSGTSVEVTRIPLCDLCDLRHLRSEDAPLHLAAVDGKTLFGAWANMCEYCYVAYGTGLGVGKGQRLILKEEL